MEVVGVEDSEAAAGNGRFVLLRVRAAGTSGSPFYFRDWDVPSHWCVSGCPFTWLHRRDRAAL